MTQHNPPPEQSPYGSPPGSYPYGPPSGLSPYGQAEVPLWAPYYQIGFGQAIRRFFTKYATFSGRASLSEYWWIVLFRFLVLGTLAALTVALAVRFGDSGPNGDADGVIIGVAGMLAVVWILGTLVPSVALVWRRLHDVNLSGAFWCFTLIGLDIVYVIMCMLPSNPAGARFDRPR